jgi:hypothetical protein
MLTIKKIVFQITLAIMLMAASTNAQDTVVINPREGVDPESLITVTAVATPRDARTKFYMGVKGGYNYANVYDTEGEKFDSHPKIGFAAGMFFTIPIGKIFGLQPEVLFSQKGFTAKGSLLGEPYRLTRTTNFIDIPLLIAVKPVPLITVLAGPQFSYLMKQRDEFKGTSENSLVEEEFKNDSIRKNRLCFLGGVDFNFTHLVVGTRVGWDVQHNLGDGTTTTPRYKNTWLQATLGARF